MSADQPINVLTDPGEIEKAFRELRFEVTDSPPNLVDVAEAWAGTPTFPVKVGDELIAQAQLSHSCWTCNGGGTEDWYFIEQFPMMSVRGFGGMQVQNLKYQFQASFGSQYLYVDTFGGGDLGPVYANNLPNGSARAGGVFSMVPTVAVLLEQPFPSTTPASKTFTSGVSKSVSGTVGFDMTSGAAASVTGGVTVEDSTSETINNVTVTNQSISPQYRVEYDFNGGAEQSSTFQSKNSFLFHMGSDSRHLLNPANTFNVCFRVNALLGLPVGLFYMPVAYTLSYMLQIPVPPKP